MDGFPTAGVIARPPSRRAVLDADLLERIRDVHAANYAAYGSRRRWKGQFLDANAVRTGWEDLDMKLKLELFQVSGDPDAQLLLALVLYLSECQAAAPEHESVVGVDSWGLWALLDEKRSPGEVHPSIDARWPRAYDVQRGLSRLRRAGLVRGPAGAWSKTLWRPTEAGYRHLADKTLFKPGPEQRRPGAPQRRAA